MSEHAISRKCKNPQADMSCGFLHTEGLSPCVHAAAIDRLLTDQPLARCYAEAAHRRVADLFTLDKMMEAMDKCYQEFDG